MKLTTIPKRPTIWEALAQRHLEQANECLRLVRVYEQRGDAMRSRFWQRIWKEKQRDYENLKSVWRAYG